MEHYAQRMASYIPYNRPDDLFVFEKDFDQKAWHRYVAENWTVTVWVSAVYVILVFAGRRYMAGRERYDLRMLLAVWSGSLAVFSILGMVRILPEFLHDLRSYGFEESVCNPAYTYMTICASPYWHCLFLLSKLVELGDTAFIVLRKQPLIFLHWYHHVTVMLFSWWSYADLTAMGRWFIVMNYCVHSVMYSYYFMRALKVKVPRIVSQVITCLQLGQMVMGIYTSAAVYQYKSAGRPCQISNKVIFFSAAMYLSYFLLFAQFFYTAYIRPRSNRSLGSYDLNVSKSPSIVNAKTKIN